MKRVALCIAILSAMIAVSLVSLFMLRSSSEELYHYIDECLLSYYENSEKLYSDIEALEICFGDYYTKASFLTRSSSLDDMAGAVARLEPLAEIGAEEFVSELNSIRYRVNLLYESQIPHFRSVF